MGALLYFNLTCTLMRRATTLTFWEFRRLKIRLSSSFVVVFFSSPHLTQAWFCLTPVSLIIVSTVCMSFTWRNHPWRVYFPKGFSNLRCLIIGAAILELESSHWGTRGVKARRVCDLEVSRQSGPRGRTLNPSLMKRAAWLHFLHSLNVLLGDIYMFLYTRCLLLC